MSDTFTPNTDAPRLFYDHPAASWTEALPVGNGRLGAMVFGQPLTERLQLNEETVWDGYPRDRHNPEALTGLAEHRDAIFAGDFKKAHEAAANKMLGVPHRVKSYQILGDLWIQTDAHVGLGAYHRELNLTRAIAETRFSPARDRTAPPGYARTVFASAPDDVLVVRLEAAGPTDYHLHLTRPQDATALIENEALILRGRIRCPHHETGENMGIGFEAHLTVGECDGEVEFADDGLHLRGCRSATLLLAAATTYRHDDPAGVCRDLLNRAANKSYDQLLADHVADHQHYFNRVDLSLNTPPNAAQDRQTPDQLPTDVRLRRVKGGADDPGLAALYFHYVRYLLISSSRPGCLPANLQGLWNCNLNACWNSDYHTNINLQMNYWPAELTGLGDCHDMLLRFIEGLVESGRETAREHYDCRGWTMHHVTDIFGPTTPMDGACGVWPVAAAWLCRHFWEHYRFNGDLTFLRDRGYPVMKEAAEFLLDFLIEAPADSACPGKLVTCPSHSPENRFKTPDGDESWFTYAATMDLQIIHDLFTNTIAAAKELETDSDFAERLAATLDRLPPMRISPRDGRLQEWIEDYEDAEPGHRHISHLYGLMPAAQITHAATPELIDGCRRVLEERMKHGGGHTGWSCAWIVNFYARLHDATQAHHFLQELFRRATLPNLMDTHPPYQLDGNCGGAAGIVEMLLQSHETDPDGRTIIRLLPALPESWASGSFRGMRARDGIQVDLAWADGRITEATLTADRDTTITLSTPDDEQTVALKADAPHSVASPTA